MLLRTSLFALAFALAACSSPVDDGADDGGTGGELGPSYESCTLNGDWDCVGIECAADPDAVHWIELIESEIELRGWSEQLFVVDAETIAETNQVLVSVVQDLGWFRAWAPINGLRTNVSDDEFRADVGTFLDALEFPDAIMAYDDVLEAFADCHADLVYDPCEANFFGFSVWAAVEIYPQPNCVEHLHMISIDLASEEVSCDIDLPPVGCD